MKINIGDVFGKLTVEGEPFVARTGSSDNNRYKYCVFRCECGNYTAKRISNVTNGSTKSCGCRAGCDKGSGSQLYYAWFSMKGRCYDKKLPGYHRYGGRGITVCKEWLNDINKFKSWAVENGFLDGLELDRIDNNGNYEPLNCRWVTSKENSRNTSKNRTLTAFGETKCLSAWVEDPRCIYRVQSLGNRLRRNLKLPHDERLSDEEILTSPHIEQIVAFGESKTRSEWCQDARCIVCLVCFSNRLRMGWTPEKSLTTPSRNKGGNI